MRVPDLSSGQTSTMVSGVDEPNQGSVIEVREGSEPRKQANVKLKKKVANLKKNRLSSLDSQDSKQKN